MRTASPRGERARAGMGGLAAYPDSPQELNIIKMAEDLKEVADLIAASVKITQKEVLSASEAASYMNVSLSHLYKLTAERKVPHFKPMGKMVYFNRLELEGWLQTNRVITDAELEKQAQKLSKKGGKK